MSVQVKICGVTSSDIVHVCADCRVSYIGFVFVKKSPRFLSVEHAESLSDIVPEFIQKVGLFCDPTLEELEKVLARVSLDMIQLHGQESVDFCRKVRETFGIKVMKAVGVAVAEDVQRVRIYEDVCDWLLFDAKPVSGADRTGGHGLAFDWSILKGQVFSKPWMLAGGLSVENVSEAIRILKPDAVDVSSGVESSRGVKDQAKICDFCKAVLSV